MFKTISNAGAVEFFDEVESLKKETKRLIENDVHIIICLSHSGIEKDKVIAKEVEDIDIIIGGHSHTFLYSGKHFWKTNKILQVKHTLILHYL